MTTHLPLVLLSACVILGCGSSEDSGGEPLPGDGQAGSPGLVGVGGAGGAPGPSDCSAAVAPYTITTTELDAAFVPAIDRFWWGGEVPNLPLVVDAENQLYVGLTGELGATLVAVGETEPRVTVPGARLGGLTVTADGFALLLHDGSIVEEEDRLWSSVRRVDTSGVTRFETEFFRSSNLDDVGTKGEAGTGRLAYVPATDTLVAYFGHQQRYDDGVRHQGGYLATVDAAGTEERLSGWYGSHNLDQRLAVLRDGRVGLYALGDTYPPGLIFDWLDAPDTTVVYDQTEAQLGDIVELSNSLLLTFLDGQSFYDAETGGGEASATRIGLITVEPGQALGPLEPRFLEPEKESGATMTYLHAVPYGPSGELILLAFRETASRTDRFFTMVVDRAGTVCQPKTELAAEHGFLGDDFRLRPDGTISWTNAVDDRILVVTLTPG